MTYKVATSYRNNYSVSISQQSNIKVSLNTKMPANLNQLADVEISGNNDKYVLMYDAASGKWRDVNPDEVLNAAAETETTQPGIAGFATSFLQTVADDVVTELEVDAGSF